ncbi:hypothetical protein GCM10027160_41410 [Streptomyces calidiresistens]|uniref:Uncharacterized protein n=1 Tax=Streptomyces calidiresistens TaxID=1485586 RepID=A0A7W3T7U2_9ACTN|nr:hypothetical protein [Streptomyces calidiresistens]MBB0232544.1 hypothetical protein [Streptomyces calidiresistens]
MNEVLPVPTPAPDGEEDPTDAPSPLAELGERWAALSARITEHLRTLDGEDG